MSRTRMAISSASAVARPQANNRLRIVRVRQDHLSQKPKCLTLNHRNGICFQPFR